MGFFSWNCKRCGHPMLSRYVANDINRWMTQVVVQTADGSRVMGEYGGYGDVGNHEIEPVYHGTTEGPECWHKDCWEASGKPEYEGPSADARDQGFFFDEGAHDIPSPLRGKVRPSAPEPEGEGVCADCGIHFCESALVPLGEIKDLGQRLEPGSTVPLGECPECGALAYLF